MKFEGRTAGLKFLAHCFRGFTGATAATLVFLILGRAAATAEPIYLKQIIDGLSANAGFAAIAGAVWIYFSLRLGTIAAEVLRDFIFAPVEIGVGRNVSENVYDYLLRLQVAFHAEQQTGALARKIARGTRALTFILDFMVMNILPTLIELVFVTALLLRLYPPAYGLITFVTVVAYTFFTVWSTEKRQVYRLNANRAEDEASGVQIDSITNIETVKYFNSEDFCRRRFGAAIQRWFDLSTRSNRLFAAITGGQNLLVLIGLGAILLLAIRQTAAGSLTVGDLVLLSTYVVRLSVPIGTLGFVYRGIKDGLADLDAMARIFDHPVEVQEPASPASLPQPAGNVAFENVTWSYPGRPPVFRNVSFSVAAGERVAIVGPSGAGKSTLVKLLFRFMDPVDGKVTIDGIDLRMLSSDTRRRLLAIVPQEPVLFNDTIRANILFGCPDAGQQEVETACRLANIAGFIESLPDGYDTTVGERGLKLSGGEKQRVAIARAILRDPCILVFDEATSSLDSHSERLIQDALDEVSRGRTTLVVAHRLSTIIDSDRIMVLQSGEIIEQGSHQELLLQNGLYAQLWQIQSRSTGEEELEIKPDALIAGPVS